MLLSCFYHTLVMRLCCGLHAFVMRLSCFCHVDVMFLACVCHVFDFAVPFAMACFVLRLQHVWSLLWFFIMNRTCCRLSRWMRFAVDFCYGWTLAVDLRSADSIDI